MTPAALLAEVLSRGVEVSPTGRGTIRVRPLSRLTPELMDGLRVHKGEILRLLTAGQTPDLIASYQHILGQLRRSGKEFLDRCADFRVLAGQLFPAAANLIR